MFVWKISPYVSDTCWISGSVRGLTRWDDRVFVAEGKADSSASLRNDNGLKLRNTMQKNKQLQRLAGWAVFPPIAKAR